MSDIAELRRWLENEVDAGDEGVQVYADMARRIEEQYETLHSAARALLESADDQTHPDDGFPLEEWLNLVDAVRGSNPATPPEVGSLVCTCGGPERGNVNFDRSICACGAMHYFCDECGFQAEECDPASSPESA